MGTFADTDPACFDPATSHESSRAPCSIPYTGKHPQQARLEIGPCALVCNMRNVHLSLLLTHGDVVQEFYMLVVCCPHCGELVIKPERWYEGTCRHVGPASVEVDAG